MEEVAVQNVLCMNGGDGETSYAKNSSIQRKIIETARSFVREAVLDLYPAAAAAAAAAAAPDKLTVADLGCSSGPNALAVVAGVVGTVEERCRQLGRPPPEFQLFLNDLPGNDFNSVFRSHALRAFYEGREGEPPRCFVAGVPGSFYGRLFPTRSVHFFHSSTSLHWLSQVPVPTLQQDGTFSNKGSAYFSRVSPPFLADAYARQFQKDFSDFLRSRSEETVVGGRMVLTLFGRKSSDPASGELVSYCGVLTRVLMDMVREGYIAEERVDSFNVPCYAPCAMEVEHEIRREGSFSLKCLKTLEVDWEASSQGDDGNHKKQSCNFSDAARTSTNCLRATIESMLTSHFGGDIIEDLFSRFYKAAEDHISTHGHTLTNLVVSLVREP